MVDLVVMGKVRYIGASSMYAYQFLGMQHVAEKNGWTKFISMQNYYNLVYREEEREMLPACKESGVGYYPLKDILLIVQNYSMVSYCKGYSRQTSRLILPS
jgi:aryl-alcohol dehydrogenase-like predicted oxidoreductase